MHLPSTSHSNNDVNENVYFFICNSKTLEKVVNVTLKDEQTNLFYRIELSDLVYVHPTCRKTNA